MPKKAWKLIKIRCENCFEINWFFDYFWYFSKLILSFLKALNVLKALFSLGRTHVAENEGNQKKRNIWRTTFQKTWKKRLQKRMQKSLKNHPKFIQKWSQNPSKNHSNIDTKKRMENKRKTWKNWDQHHEKWIGISRAYWILSRIKTNILQKDTRGKIQGRVHPKWKHILSEFQHAWRVPAARGRILERF